MEQFFKELDTAVFQARLTLTQDDSGNNDVWLNIKAANGTRLLITEVFMQMNAPVASGRSSQLEIRDSGGNMYKRFQSSSLGDNAYMTMGLGSDGNYTRSPQAPVILANDDKLVFRSASLAQNESYTIIVRGYLRGRLPTYDTSGSGATPSVASDYFIAV